MKEQYDIHPVPFTRIAGFDVFSVGLSRHHVAALIELDVTESRRRIKQLRREGTRVSFHAWLLKVIASVVVNHTRSAGFLADKRKIVTFKDVNISIVVEKDLNGEKVPIPLVITNAQTKTAEEITAGIEKARSGSLTEKDIVLHRKSHRMEKLYYLFPGFLRRYFWRVLLARPRFAFRTMGNVSVTTPGMGGSVKGWFIHKAIHPLSFGLGTTLQKPVAFKGEICLREILSMTVLIDHDVIDGAPMVRFVKELTHAIEKGDFL